MLKYILKRIGLMLVTFIAIMIVTFILFKSLPVAPPQNTVEALWQEKMGYGKPILQQLVIYFKNIVTEWYWGTSMKLKPYTPVWTILFERLPPSMIVSFGAIIIGVPVGLLLGFYAAMKKNKWQDHTVSTLVVVVISVPSFVYGFLIFYFLNFKFQWFPILFPMQSEVGGWLSPGMLHAMFPAMLTLSFGYIASMTRNFRAELTEVMTSDYLLLARTKGLTRRQAILRHAVKNAMVPILPGIIAMLIGILSGSMITEQIFGIPGIGRLFLDALGNLDYDVLMVDSMFFVFISLLSSILLDISRGFLDPRIRVGSRKGGNF